jgi:aspartyl-tRNA(Asn)/glutamyl-tRNA(Gln) amidotransferase subunit C
MDSDFSGMMPTMTKEEILHLGRLSRIALTSEEVDTFQTSIDSILEYVSVVTEMAASAEGEKKVGARYNVLRPDVVTEPAGAHADTLLEAMPKRDGRFLSVKKILNQTE